MARKPRRLPQVLAEDEPEKLIAAATLERERLILLLMLMIGLRVSEVCRLRVEHLDFRRKILWVRCGKGSLDAACPMPKHLTGPLRGYVGARQEGPLFVSPKGGHYKKRAIQLMIKRLAKKAGIKDYDSPRVRCHALRHCFCERLLLAGVPIDQARDLMRHRDLTSTNRYANCDPSRLRDAIEAPYS